MRLGKGLATFLLAVLMGCGGGYVSVSIGSSFSDDDPFVIWTGNSSSDRIVDANNQIFAFYVDSGCLYNFQTHRENPTFCLTTGGNMAQYGGFLVRIVNVRVVTGACVTALVDPVTARFIDVEVDAFGREVLFITEVHPQLCIV